MNSVSTSLCQAILMVASVLVFALAAPAQLVISEFCAVNNTRVDDEDGDSSDWIEIWNSGGTSINLQGYRLTDQATNLSKWTFPTANLPGGGRLLVFASGKNRATPGSPLHTNFQLSNNGEFLGLVSPTGAVISDFGAAYPPQFPDVSYGRSTGNPQPTGYYRIPTPGTANGPSHDSVVGTITASPAAPSNTDDVVVTTEVIPAPGRTIVGVSLRYRVNQGTEVVLTMSPIASGYQAVIPNGASGPGDLLRWRVVATDSAAVTTTGPLYPGAESPRYLGTVIPDGTVSSPNPVFSWFVANPSAASTTTGTRGAVWFGGVLYDEVMIRARGGSSLGWPKRSLKFDFNPGYLLQHPTLGTVEEVNLNSNWGDKAHIRQTLSYEMYDAVGCVGSAAFPVHARENGAFHSLATWVEQPDERYLARQGLDPQGALYKMYNECTSSTSSVEKKTRLSEGNSDLAAVVSGASTSGVNLERFVFDSLDVPAVISYLVGTLLIHDNDHVAKNYYLYRDSDGDGEWRFLPWDKDLVWGRNYTLTGGVLNDTMWANVDPYSHPLFADQQHPKVDGPWNRLIDACYRQPRFRAMYLQRLRTCMDEILQAPGTPFSQRVLEGRIAQQQTQLMTDAALDQSAWGVPAYGNTSLTFLAASNQLSTDYLEPRRIHLFQTHSGPNGLIPPAPSGPPAVRIAQVEASSQNPSQGFVQLVNCGNEAVDVSNWLLAGGTSFFLPAGTVILPGESVYVARNVAAFRGRAVAPSGNQGLLVVGPLSADLTPGLALQLYNRNFQLVDGQSGLTLAVTTTGVGDVTLGLANGPPFAPYYLATSFDTSFAVGCGPALGLGADAVLVLTIPFGTPPFSGNLSGTGTFGFSAGPGTLSAGITIDGRAIAIDPVSGQPRLSNIRRITF